MGVLWWASRACIENGRKAPGSFLPRLGVGLKVVFNPGYHFRVTWFILDILSALALTYVYKYAFWTFYFYLFFPLKITIFVHLCQCFLTLLFSSLSPKVTFSKHFLSNHLLHKMLIPQIYFICAYTLWHFGISFVIVISEGIFAITLLRTNFCPLESIWLMSQLLSSINNI